MVEASGLHIVRMGEHHLREVFSLIENENWGWEFAEIEQTHNLDPGSSVVALDGQQIVGLVTCVDFGSLAFIIHVIVRKGWRRKGVGVRMMEEVLAELDSRGVPSVELHANPEAVDFYDQFSFKRVEDISFFAKDPPHSPSAREGSDSGFSLVPPEEARAVSETLSQFTGYVQGDIERALSRLPPNQVLTVKVGGRTRAMLLSRTGLDLNATGPWVMDKPAESEAGAMMRAMLQLVPAKRVDILTPGSNSVARAALISCGYSAMKDGIVRVVRSSAPVRAFPESLLAVSHVGLI